MRRAAIITVAVLAVTSASAVAMRSVLAGRPGVRALPEFSIRGGVTGLLAPGGRRPVRLVITNPHPFPLRLTHLHVHGRVGDPHRAAGCAMGRDYVIRQLRRPVRAVLPPRSTSSLGALGLRPRPALGLVHDAQRNQDACKGAKVTLHYTGRATRA